MSGQSNGSTCVNQRETAVRALIESFETRYPEKGFLLHPSLQFLSPRNDHRGMHVVAKNAIEKGQSLLVIPTADMIQSSRTPKELIKLHEKFTKKYQSEAQKIECIENAIPLSSTWLAMNIMNLLSKKSVSRSSSFGDSPACSIKDPFELQSDTWPSEDELKDSYYGYWNKEKVEDIWGYKSGLTMNWIYRIEKLNQVFERIVYPLLQKESCGGKKFIDKTLPSNSRLLQSEGCSQKELLRNTYWYADGIVHTRTHEMENIECQVIPLVELFNGDTCGASVKNSTSVNVNLVRGKWPFLGGGNFYDECNLPCSCAYAVRNINAGEELIISYGDDLTVNDFVIKYGAIPKSLLDPSRVRCNVRLWCDPAFLDQLDPPRIACLRKSGFPLEDLANDRNCNLMDLFAYGDERVYQGSTALELYNRGIEETGIASMRHFLILAVLADDFELNRNLTTGRLRGPLYESKVMPLMCRMIDFNLGLLQGAENATSSADDAKRAQFLANTDSGSSNHWSTWEASALLARVMYRETLLVWRHAFLKKAVDLAGPTTEDLLYETAHPCRPAKGKDCAICGRTYPSLKCSRCKRIQYCCREHQKLDWKRHKGNCSRSGNH